MLRLARRVADRASTSARGVAATSEARSIFTLGVRDGARAFATTTDADAREATETPEARARRTMRDGARKVREAADAGGARGESWGWVYDLTESGEMAERWVNQANARLSDRAKTQMYAMHGEDPVTWSVDALAAKYRVRKQRVGAILALKRREEEAVKANRTLFHDTEAAMERASGSVDIGTGERHVADVPTMPQFQTVSAFDHGRDAKPKRFVEASELARKQERVLVREFFERLEYNVGERGQGLRRVSRRASAPPRPEGGYALHVTPLGDTNIEPYVAYKDGTQRPLNDDEAEHARQKTPKRRRRII